MHHLRAEPDEVLDPALELTADEDQEPVGQDITSEQLKSSPYPEHHSCVGGAERSPGAVLSTIEEGIAGDLDELIAVDEDGRDLVELHDELSRTPHGERTKRLREAEENLEPSLP